MSKKTISIRVTQATYEDFEEYRHDQGTETEPLSKADAGRKLIESGLNTEQSDHPPRQSDTERDTDDDGQPRGRLAATMSLAGDSLREQLNSLGWWVAFTGLFVFFSTVLPGGPIWLIPAAVLGFASIATIVAGIGLGLLELLDPDPTPQSDPAGSKNEVEQ